MSSINVVDFLWCSTTDDSEFHLSIARSVELVHLATRATSVSFGAEFYEFIRRAVLAILDAGLVEDFKEFFNHAWHEQELVPDVAVSLTARGRLVLEQVARSPDHYLSLESFSDPGAGSPAEIAQFARASCEQAEAEHEEWSARSALRYR